MCRLMCLCMLAILTSCGDNDDDYGQEVEVIEGKALVQRCYIKGTLGAANFEVDRRNDFSQDVYHAYTFFKDAAASAEGQVGVDWVVTLLSQPRTELLLHLKRPEIGTAHITRGQVDFKLSDMSRYEVDGMAVRVYNGDGKIGAFSCTASFPDKFPYFLDCVETWDWDLDDHIEHCKADFIEVQRAYFS